MIETVLNFMFEPDDRALETLQSSLRFLVSLKKEMVLLKIKPLRRVFLKTEIVMKTVKNVNGDVKRVDDSTAIMLTD